MTTLESIIEELKKLPPPKLEAAAEFIRGLSRKPLSDEERRATIDRLCGSLSPEVADAMEKAIEEAFEQQ